MRLIQLYPPPKRTGRKTYICRLWYSPDGRELIACVTGGDRPIREDNGFGDLYKYAFADGVVSHAPIHWSHGDGAFYSDGADISPDGRYLLREITIEGAEEEPFLELRDLRTPDTHGELIPTHPIGDWGVLLFTPDGKAVSAERAVADGDGTGPREIARFDLEQLTRRKPLTHSRPREGAASGLKWRTLLASVGWGRSVAGALSADGRFLAVVDAAGASHVADLKRKRVVASWPSDAEPLADRRGVGMAFDPKAEWVVLLTGGRLFARPIKNGTAWRTELKLRRVNDFAFHPSGEFLCAVFSDGQARYLNPTTGEVRQSFKWSKKPTALYSVAFSPDGLTCAAGSENGQVVVWDVDS